MHTSLERIAVIGNALPRRCGIATFTTDLCIALERTLGTAGRVVAIAMNDTPGGYAYPERVRFQVRAAAPEDYLAAATFLNNARVQVTVLQHEYGIFGGLEGAHVLPFLQSLHMPLLTTLHTVLRQPSEAQRAVMDEIIALSDLVIVMSNRAREILYSTHDVLRDKVVMIPHGVPNVPFAEANTDKHLFGLEASKVILSFGLLSPDKGIEYMIQAMPSVLQSNPDAKYIVLGILHPHVQEASPNEYRRTLERLVRDLDIRDHVVFQNRFVSLGELCQHISAADIYVTPYLNPDQIVSGTLAYALAAGKAVVSTPYSYAEEMLSEHRGVLVPFRNARALAEQINALFANPVRSRAMRKRAYLFCRSMVWDEVAERVIEVSKQIVADRAARPRLQMSLLEHSNRTTKLPEPDLRHLRVLTDDTGIFQHATHAVPDHEYGYCTDDNARALITVLRAWSLLKDDRLLSLARVYLAFLSAAFNRSLGQFRNFMSADRKWLEDSGSEDSQGRALWALGFTIAHAPTQYFFNAATRIFNEALGAAARLRFLRAWAFSAIGIELSLTRVPGHTVALRICETLVERLLVGFRENATDTWPWPEDSLTYANGVIPYALLRCGQRTGSQEAVGQGLRALRWLLQLQTGRGECLSVIGNKGWMTRGEQRATFDQQPLEACNLVRACAEAYRITEDAEWRRQAERCIGWFLGNNDKGISLLDPKTGGCYDGLTADGLNSNQGAESTLAWLDALLVMYGLEHLRSGQRHTGC